MLLQQDTAVYARPVSCSNLSLILLRNTVFVGHGKAATRHPEKSNRRPRLTNQTWGTGLSEPVEKTVSRLQKNGAKFHGPIVEDKSGRLAFLDDPDGNALYLHELKEEYRVSRPATMSA
jgi:hypothetical protein